MEGTAYHYDKPQAEMHSREEAEEYAEELEASWGMEGIEYHYYKPQARLNFQGEKE